MAAALTITPAGDDDLPAIHEIDRLTFPDPWPLDELARELSRDFARLEVARVGDGEEITGFINYWLVHDEVQLIKVATHPGHQRRGVGRELMLGMLATAAMLELRSVTLEVRVDNVAAIALYRGFGFVEVGRRPRYYPDGTDALLMDLRLEDD